MADKELVITHLQIIHTWAEFARERDLQFFTSKHLEDIAQWSEDAINLLKEQEAVEPDTDSEGTCTCGNCGETVGYYPVGCKTPQRLCKFCPECGRAVKWK